MINMRDIVSRLQFTKQAHIERLVLGKSSPKMILMKAFKDLVVRITNDLGTRINKSLMDGFDDGDKLDLRSEIFEDGVETFDLAGIG